MNTRLMFAVAGLCLLLAASVLAVDLPRYVEGHQMIYGRAESFNKASGDTIDLMGPTGSGAPYIGDFEGGWNGWTSIDLTQPTESHWQVSNYNQAVVTNLAAWCGDISLEACNDSLDEVGGYGNNWQDLLAYRAAVADPGVSTTVSVSATLQNDSEPGYDFTYLSAKIQGNLGYTDVQSWDGTGTYTVSNGLTILPSELIGGTDVYILFRFQSDGGWSDADCSFYGVGACQIDDITVTVSQAGQADIVSFTDFQDNTFGDWFIDLPAGVGDFAGLWSGLSDLDDCHTNFTQQVAFIDDGIVVPGTGGTNCINWCYGPGGFIVNTTGGLAGPDYHLEVNIQSPDMLWPNDNYDGIRMAFDVYRHEDLSSDAPGVFYTWGINSADTDGSAGNGVQDLDTQNYLDRSFVYYGGPDYTRGDWEVTDLMNPGRDEIRIRLGVYELGWAWGWTGNDGYPAPYFDNVSVKIFPYAGPGMSAREIDLAQDNFPEVDAINLLDLGSMHVRFDMASNISLANHLRNDPGDSLVINISAVRSGAVLAGNPEMHYVIEANPVFDAYRTTATSGFVYGEPAIGSSGIPRPDHWAFDLPDTGTLFPGDVLHYYIRAGDDVAGDVQYATMPGDLTGYGDFSDPLAYNSSFVVRALPSINSDGFGGFNVTDVLFWNDFANRGGENEWYYALQFLGFEGRDYDIYYTNGPSSGVGNGLGGRTSGLALEHYNDLIYTAGDLSVNTLSNGDYDNDAGDDIGALLNWLSAGGKDLMITGDDVASDLSVNAGAAGIAFRESVMGLNFSTDILRSFIGNQSSPLVFPISGNPVITNIASWIAYGGCPSINSFDGVTAAAGATRLAEFGDPNNNPGAYTLSAATYNVYNATNRTVSFPYDFMHIATNPAGKYAAPLSARTQILLDVLDFFGVAGPIIEVSVPEFDKFAVANYPNPFNPTTVISYVVPRAGHLSLKIFNVRGQLVRTLINGRVEASGDVMWDGRDNQGSEVSSGVYFYEARLGAEVKVNKMALIK